MCTYFYELYSISAKLAYVRFNAAALCRVKVLRSGYRASARLSTSPTRWRFIPSSCAICWCVKPLALSAATASCFWVNLQPFGNVGVGFRFSCFAAGRPGRFGISGHRRLARIKHAVIFSRVVPSRSAICWCVMPSDRSRYRRCCVAVKTGFPFGRVGGSRVLFISIPPRASERTLSHGNRRVPILKPAFLTRKRD